MGIIKCLKIMETKSALIFRKSGEKVTVKVLFSSFLRSFLIMIQLLSLGGNLENLDDLRCSGMRSEEEKLFRIVYISPY